MSNCRRPWEGASISLQQQAGDTPNYTGRHPDVGASCLAPARAPSAAVHRSPTQCAMA